MVLARHASCSSRLGSVATPEGTHPGWRAAREKTLWGSPMARRWRRVGAGARKLLRRRREGRKCRRPPRFEPLFDLLLMARAAYANAMCCRRHVRVGAYEWNTIGCRDSKAHLGDQFAVDLHLDDGMSSSQRHRSSVDFRMTDGTRRQRIDRLDIEVDALMKCTEPKDLHVAEDDFGHLINL